MQLKILALMMTLALMAGGVSYGTFAFFSDGETSTQNIFTGATLDLQTDDAQGISGSITDTSMTPGDSTSGSVVLKNAGGLLSGTVLDILVETDNSPAPDTWAEKQALNGADQTGEEYFGRAVAIDGNTMVVGAYRDSIGTNNWDGSAYVFTTSDGGLTWVEQQKLTVAGSADSDFFGYAADISGDTIVVGAYNHDESAGNEQGAAYVFTRSGSTWTQQQKLLASDAAPNDQFGIDVAVDGAKIVVGAWRENALGTESGSAYVFTTADGGATWTEQQKLTASDGADDNFFGHGVDIDGDSIVAGAYSWNCGGGSDCGAAYVFTTSDGGSTWSQQQKLSPGDLASGDHFGYSVAIDGDTVIAGAQYNDDAGTNSGSAYIFTRSGSTWTEQQKLTASDASSQDLFGSAVDVDGNKAIVGAFQADAGGQVEGGQAYLFSTGDGGATWSQDAILAEVTPGVGDHLGRSVAVAGDIAATGADNSDEQGGNSGLVLAYKFVAGGTDLAAWLLVTQFDYDGVGLTLPGDVDGDGRANTLADLNDNGAFTGQAAPGASGKTLAITVQLDEAATEDVMGESESMTLRFLLRQSGAPSL